MRSSPAPAFRRQLAALALLAAASSAVPADAQTVDTVGDLRAAGAVRLSHADLQDLVPGARVVTYLPTDRNVDRAWTNHADGRFTASWRRTGLVTIGGQGGWSLVEKEGIGQYCVDIRWQANTQSWREAWCASVYRLGERYFGAREVPGRDDPGVTAGPVEISRPIAMQRTQP